MKKIFVFFLFALSSCGIPYCRKSHLSEEELKWVEVYNVKDTVMFYNDNMCDTMIVSNKEIDNKSFISPFDLKSCNWLEGETEYNAIASVSFKIKHHNNFSWWDGGFIITKNQDQTFSIMVDFGGLYSDDINLSNHHDTCLYIIDGKNAAQGSNQPLLQINQIIWSKKNGLVGYRFKDGRYYTRRFKNE